MERRDVGILGATGTVGQRFIQLLADHPWFRITWLAASERSQGKPYAEACTWKLDTPLPPQIASMVLQPNTPEGSTTPLPRILFASVDTAIARELEPRFAAAGCAVISNSSAFRMAPDVPLVIPEVNLDHLELLEEQPTRRGAGGREPSGGYIVTNPNCTVMGPVMALHPLQQSFGVEAAFVTSMQAVSGAGYPGVPSLDILGNVIPFIQNEEEKVQEEARRLLGALDGNSVRPLEARISAHCNRVPVDDGHTVCVSVKLKTPATYDEVLAAFTKFQPFGPNASHLGVHLPTAPVHPLEFEPAPDRPQPRLDRNRGHGMAVTVGRLRPCPLLDWKFVVLSHNTLRGAAGAAVLNAELLAVLGKFNFKRFPALASGAGAGQPVAESVMVDA